jgi:nucleoside-diphosphate-sugar epimerase
MTGLLKFDFKVAIRVMADVLLVNLALLIALAARYLWLVGVEGVVVSAQDTFYQYIAIYLSSFLILTPICLIVFHYSGFYGYTRYYQNRYKALVITQAVSLSYLTFSFLVFLSWDVFWLPRSILLPAWFLTIVFLIGARATLETWRRVTRVERRNGSTKNIKKKRVLVIGGAGYIGSALLPKLLNKGYQVRLLDVLLYGTEPIQEVLYHPNLEIVQADFRQVDAVVEAMRDVETVIHLGAIVGDPACALDEELTIEINLMATRMIAEVAKGSGVSRFIFASTCSVYGASDELLDEHSLLNPVSLYARSKIASERVLMQMANEHFAPVILRFGTIYGLSGRTRFDLVVNLLTAKAMVDGEITVYGGDQWRPFVHVDDAALAVFKIMEAPLPLVRKQIFNVGSDEQNYKIEEIGEIIDRLVPTAQLKLMGNDTDQRNYRVNFNKLHYTLGFVPQWTLEQGVKQVIEAIQAGKIKDYRAPEYSNVKFLSNGNKHIGDMLRRQNGWAYDLLKETSPEYKAVVAPAASALTPALAIQSKG